MLLFDGHEWTSTLAYMFDEAKADFSSFLFPSVETDGNGVYCKVHCRMAFQIYFKHAADAEGWGEHPTPIQLIDTLISEVINYTWAYNSYRMKANHKSPIVYSVEYMFYGVDWCSMFKRHKLHPTRKY